MQVRTPDHGGFPDLTEKRRRRRNDRLHAIAAKPLEDARANYEPWSFKNGKWTFSPDDAWLDACVEYNRRLSLYYALVPLKDWGI